MPHATSSAPSAPSARYRSREASARSEVERLEGRSRRISTLRAVAFIGGVGSLLLLETTPRSAWLFLISVGAAGLFLFGYLMHRHGKVRREKERAEVRIALAREGLARLNRRWDALPVPDLGSPRPLHPWAKDLDILGRASVAHLLGTVSTAPGRAALRSALLDPLAPPPADPEAWLAALAQGEDREGENGESPLDGDGAPDWTGTEAPPPGWAARRQARAQGARELAGHPDVLEAMHLEARVSARGRRRENPGRFLNWARGPGWTRDRRWAVPAARALALGTPALLVLWFTGTLALPWWIGGAVASLALHRRVEGEANTRFAAAESAEASVGQWAAVLEAGRRIPGESPALADIRTTLGDEEGEPTPPEALRRLRSLSDWAGVRRSSLIHFPLVALFSWDIHILHRVEKWRSRHGSQVDGWVRTLGELELLGALATLAGDHPEWGWAELHAGPSTVPERDGPGPSSGHGIRAEALRHPLLHPEEAVSNPLELPPPGSLLLVTGSNMSGKSTLLRAVGVNQLLALMGGPVAAEALRTHPALPWTAMRIQDSLSQGVSFFLAELRRLHQVVAAARRGPVLVLLDEILQGTNTAERRIAARTILRHLLRTTAVGAVSTHDLTLADAEDLGERLVEVHFLEDVRTEDGRRTLTFDHRLRDGPATSRNALLLLEMVGLGPDPEDPVEDEAAASQG